jgi:hypothetical protein
MGPPHWSSNLVLYSSEVQQPRQPLPHRGASRRTSHDLYDRLCPLRLELRIRRLEVRILPSAQQVRAPPGSPRAGLFRVVRRRSTATADAGWRRPDGSDGSALTPGVRACAGLLRRWGRGRGG